MSYTENKVMSKEELEMIIKVMIGGAGRQASIHSITEGLEYGYCGLYDKKDAYEITQEMLKLTNGKSIELIEK